jgi:hypothetical protein
MEMGRVRETNYHQVPPIFTLRVHSNPMRTLLTPGTGRTAQKFIEMGPVFDSSYARGSPTTFVGVTLQLVFT